MIITSNNKYVISFEIKRIIICLIFISTIFFNGGVYQIIDLKVLNSYYDLLYLFFYLFLPLVSTYILFYFFTDDIFTFEIKQSSALIVILFLLFIIANYLKNSNLFSDEIYYTNQCFNIINVFFKNINFNESSLFGLLSYGGTLRIFLTLQWIITIIILLGILKIIDAHYGIKIFLTLLFILKLLLIYFMADSDIHPPMNSFIASIFIVLFGLNPISIKLSIVIVTIFFILYLHNRLKMPVYLMVLIVIYILLIPIIGNATIYFEQALYSFICFSIILIEIFYKKLKPHYLILIISIFSLFRYTSIAAYPVACVYSIFFFYRNSRTWNEFIIKFFKSLTPIILSIPIIIFPLVFGTPATGRVNHLNNSLKTVIDFSGSLTENSINIFGLSLIIPIATIIFLLALKKFRTIGYIFIIYFCYHSLHKLSSASIYHPKYYLEQFGYIFVFGIIFLVTNFYKLKRPNRWIKFIVFGLFFFILSSFNFYTKKENINSKKHNESFGLVNNHHNYLFDYIESNNIYKNALVIGIDYGPAFLAFYNANLLDYINYRNNWINYKKRKNAKGIEWLKLDSKLINDLENIDYIFITDYIYDKNKKNIDELINLYGWKSFGYIPKTYNFSDIHLLKRS